MAELTHLDEKLAEVLGLAQAAQVATMNRPGVVGDFWPWKQGGSYANGSWSWKVDEQALFG